MMGHGKIVSFTVLAAMVVLFAFGNGVVYMLTYIAVFVCLICRTCLTRGNIRLKLGLFVAYSLMLASQIVLYSQIVWWTDYDIDDTIYWLRKLACTLVLLLPTVVSRYVTVDKYARLYLPSVAEVGAIGFAEFSRYAGSIRSAANKAGRIRSTLTRKNIREIIADIPRHSSFDYINNGSLTSTYFKRAEKTLRDENVYIVISKTGSAASEVISLFTNKTFNHASLSFDRELETIISYNGGGRVYPPGLNPEFISLFEKHNAEIFVYSLGVTREQKQKIIDCIREINRDGSAYNMLGLITKHSYKPNIMFCSQFVYRMLKLVGAAYFEKPSGKVEPTDLVEMDYHRKLKFEYELTV